MTTPTLSLDHPRRGTILVAVLVVTLLLILAGYQFQRVMLAEYETRTVANELVQARQLAESGVHYAAYVLAFPAQAGLSDSDESLAVASPALAYHNSSMFHFRPVPSGDPHFPNRGYFSLLSPRHSSDNYGTDFRFGVEDESGKLNLNALWSIDRRGRIGRAVLEELLSTYTDAPADVAKAIMTWTRQQGDGEGTDATDWYNSRGYVNKGMPFESIEELLLVYGVTPAMVYGEDLNRNGILDAGEDTNGNGRLDGGLSHYVTVYSREPVWFAADGSFRVDVNGNDAALLMAALEAAFPDNLDLVNFIAAYRLYGNSRNSKPVQGKAKPKPTRNVDGFPKSDDIDWEEFDLVAQNGKLRRINSVFDLVDVEIRIEKEKEIVVYRSPIRSSSRDSLRTYLPLLWDRLQIRTPPTNGDPIPRLNVNTAPPEVLAAFLKGIAKANKRPMSDSTVRKILDARPTTGNSKPEYVWQTPIWLITEAGLSYELGRILEYYLTTRSSVYRVQSIGYTRVDGPVARIEAVVDVNFDWTVGRPVPRILYYRDVTELGKNLDLQTFLLQE